MKIWRAAAIFFPSHDKNVSSGGILSARRCLRTRIFFLYGLTSQVFYFKINRGLYQISAPKFYYFSMTRTTFSRTSKLSTTMGSIIHTKARFYCRKFALLSVPRSEKNAEYKCNTRERGKDNNASRI